MERNWFERTSSNASNIRLANGTDPSTPPGHNEKVDYNPNVPVQVVFGTISFLALFGNFFLAVVILSNRRLLCKRYNVLILNLAVTDMCTGIFLVATPDYVIDRRSFPYPSGLAGEIYCRLIGSTYTLYVFSKASTSSIMFLAIDRWCSIVKPIRYKTAFSRRRLYIYITLIWVSACLTQINELFIAAMEDGLCIFISPSYGPEVERLLILVHVVLTFYIPSIVTWVTFVHIWWKMRTPTVSQHMNNAKATKRLLRMCALAAFFLTMCWLPAETLFVLYKFDIVKLPFTVYLVANVLAMSNSILNPWIYCLSNREYRRQFVALLCYCCRSGSDVSASSFSLRVLDRLPLPRNVQYFVTKPAGSASAQSEAGSGAYVLSFRRLPAKLDQSPEVMTNTNLGFSTSDVTTPLGRAPALSP